MPWNDNANPGPWGSPPSGDDDGERREARGPRRPPPGGRGPRRPDGPDFSAQFERIQERIRRFLGGPGSGGVRPGAIAAIAGAAFALWALSGFYIVQPHEQGVVTTFGRFSHLALPGLRYHLPGPIQRVEKVGVTNLNQTMVGGTARGDLPEESLMLTGDENIVDLDFAVTWRVARADRYIFNIRDQEAGVKAVAESAMREVVGKTRLADVLTTGRSQVQLQSRELMQRTLDYWNSGITVVEVQIRSANPPAEVVAAFRDVTTANQDAESAINEANTYRNRVINEAKGDAARIVQAAQGYREQAVREATGEAARFNQIYGEYTRAPGVTRDRLYIETMQRVLQRSNKVVIDSEGASAPIILPPDVFRPRTATQPQPQQQPQVVPAPEAQAQGAQR